MLQDADGSLKIVLVQQLRIILELIIWKLADQSTTVTNDCARSQNTIQQFTIQWCTINAHIKCLPYRENW